MDPSTELSILAQLFELNALRFCCRYLCNLGQPGSFLLVAHVPTSNAFRGGIRLMDAYETPSAEVLSSQNLNLLRRGLDRA